MELDVLSFLQIAQVMHEFQRSRYQSETPSSRQELIDTLVTGGYSPM
jgi:hypothetical protein